MSDETTLYRLYGPEETLLYVGISDHPWRRFQQHAATQPWWGDVRGLSLDRFPDRSQALEADPSQGLGQHRDTGAAVVGHLPARRHTPSPPQVRHTRGSDRGRRGPVG